VAPAGPRYRPLQIFHETHGEEVVVLGVSQQEDVGSVERFVSEFALDYPIVLDRDGDVSTAYHAGHGLPISFVVDPDGVIQWTVVGRLRDEHFDRLSVELLP
jgi:peroxiredoxin